MTGSWLIEQDAQVQEDVFEFATRLLALPGVRVLDVDARMKATKFHIETTADATTCLRCGSEARLAGSRNRMLVDLPLHGEATRLIWHQRIWRCASSTCPVDKWTEEDPEIAVGPEAKTSARYDRAQG